MSARSLAFAVLGLGALVVACGGSTATSSAPASASLTGTVGGVTFPVASETALVGAASATSTCDGDGGTGCVTGKVGSRITVLLSSRADLTCAALQTELAAGESPAFANLDLLELDVAAGAGLVSAGSYSISSDPTAATRGASVFTAETATCSTGLQIVATSGTITVTSVSADAVAGTYDVTFGASGSFAGAFTIPLCAVPDAGPEPAGTSACQP